MRLLRLRVRNIASMKGEHEVDFMEIQRESTLFAITGETGAGKSTILNCIGLALYGSIYKKNVQQIDVVTLGEKEGSIELIFQIKGKNYLADWKVRVRKQNGEPYSTPQSPVRNLYTLDGSDFSSPKNISSEGAAELLNLDFDQFCKCIILNQGEFAKFLSSSFTERKDILEKLYPGELLESLGRELKKEIEELESSKHDIDIKLGELRGEGPSGEELKHQKEALAEKLKEHEVTFKNIEETHFHFTSLLSYYDKHRENEQKKGSIQKELSELTTTFNLLLKKGEAIQESHSESKKEHEIKLPYLQTFLKKEETLAHLEEGWKALLRRSEELSHSLSECDKKLGAKCLEERESGQKLETVRKSLRLAPEKLRTERDNLNRLFELFSEAQLLEEERKGKAERLAQLEASGKELRMIVEEKERLLSEIPSDIGDLEKKAEEKKQTAAAIAEKKQRAEIHLEELRESIKKELSEIKLLEEKQLSLKTFIDSTREEILPMEATLKLQEVLSAKEVCLEHALAVGKEECPVCENPVTNAQWSGLKLKLASMDLKKLRVKFEEKSKLLYQSIQEEELFSRKAMELNKITERKEKDLLPLEEISKTTVASLQDLDAELEKLKRQSWEAQNLRKEILPRKDELHKIREQYLKVKGESAEREKLLKEKEEKLEQLQKELSSLLSGPLTPDVIRDLKSEMRTLELFLEEERRWMKVVQEKEFLEKEKKRDSTERAKVRMEEESQLKKVEELKEELHKNLQGEKAADLITKLNLKASQALDAWNRHLELQRNQEQHLKQLQGRLLELESLKKDYDLQFTRELHAVREVASSCSHPEVMKLKEMALEFHSPRELFIPVKELLEQEKENAKKLSNDCRMNFAAVSARLTDWEKLQDKIQLLELKRKDIQEVFDRKFRLYEVLGKDDLRTFVLSLVEEGLIHQTNFELQKLCQGRYEIVHQTRSMKMAPEFYILDKFRDGGKRKVSTLSGGETFMVSLAMALGLAEMTRGTAEIDSLFIDEGFGTLDQESLEDVLDMLQQIQTRGLMVGIISHIKALTNSIPVNLVLTKGQEGSSSVFLRRN